jgi:hypothetical protein
MTKRHRHDDELGPEPCYGCRCCGLWATSLETLRDHITRHVEGELRVAPCSENCLVCAEITWQSAQPTT